MATPDDELNRLDENLRRLKVEYDAYFNGGAPHPPRDTIFRVESVLKRFAADPSGLNFGQRFRLNQFAQRYAVYSELWRKRLRDLEEGRGRREPAARPAGIFLAEAADPAADARGLQRFFEAWLEARRRTGEGAAGVDADAFAGFIREKTAEVRRKLGCESVEFRVAVEGGRVRLKAARG